MELTKFKKVNGKAVDIVPTFAGYVVIALEKTPSFVGGLINIILACICGYVFAVGLPGLFIASAVALYLMVPIALYSNGPNGEHSGAGFGAALIMIIFYGVPLLIIITTFNQWASSGVWATIFNLNLKGLMLFLGGGSHVLANVIMFICDLFSGYEVNMRIVLLADKDWSFWVVCSYHLLIILPFMLGMFCIGVNMYFRQPTIEEKLKFVFMMLIPVCWVWYVIKNNLNN